MVRSGETTGLFGGVSGGDSVYPVGGWYGISGRGYGPRVSRSRATVPFSRAIIFSMSAAAVPAFLAGAYHVMVKIYSVMI